MKIGICFGGYCPLHRGHMDIIMRARKECDKTFVVVCGYDNEPRANQIGLDLNARYHLIKEFLTDDITSVIKVNDTELGLDESCSLSNWKIWTTKVINEVNDKINHRQFIPQLPNDFQINKDNIVFYVAETAYATALSTLGFTVNYFNKSTTKISGTEIRKQPCKYWKYITAPFRPYMVTKILVIGTASEGKTTLCKDISRYFNIPWVPEYGREYMALSGQTDQDLSLGDFKAFIDGQTKSVLNCIANQASHTGMLISDTDNLITLMYAYAYAHRDDMPNMSEADYNELKEYAEDNINTIKWDYIVLLCPTESFTDDNTRFMGQSSLQERIKNFEYLKQLVYNYYNDIPKVYLQLSGSSLNDGVSTFNNNFNIVADIIKTLYEFNH